MSQITGNIYVTKDYSQFKTLYGNRDVSPERYKKIETSMLLKQLPIPIVVNEKYEVIDGQGRLSVCSRNNLPVWYVVCEGLTIDDCVTCNIYSTKWSETDVLKRYAKTGNENYQRILAVMEEYKVNRATVQLASSKLACAKEKAEAIKLGNLVFSEQDASVARERLNFARDIIEAISSAKPVKQINILRQSIMRCAKEPGYDHERMREKCYENAIAYRECSSISDMLIQLAGFYNRGKKSSFMDTYGTGSALKVTFSSSTNRYARGK